MNEDEEVVDDSLLHNPPQIKGSPMTTYTAIAKPAGKYWLIRILGFGSSPEDGVPAHARNLAEVEPMARDLIAVWSEVAKDSFRIELVIELPDPVRHHLNLARKYADAAAHAQAVAAAERRAAARKLRALGLTMRDIGAALGISHQRAYQLLSHDDDGEVPSTFTDAEISDVEL